jgi:hypothetical protein
MQASGWLPLNEYSNKYNVSTSTLRRRIRSNEIEFQFRDGKYWLKDVETARGYKSTTPIYTQPVMNMSQQQPPQQQSVASTRSASEVADKLVTELKGAYVLILQEKEEMILQLKEEVADLKTLVRILESENERLRSSSGHSLPDVGQWLEEPLEP